MNPVDKSSDDIAQQMRSLLGDNESYFPKRLCANYPKIVEKICLLWLDPKVLHKYFTELMTTDRTNREGFPPEVHHEIFVISNYYSTLHPKPQLGDNFWNGIDTR